MDELFWSQSVLQVKVEINMKPGCPFFLIAIFSPWEANSI
jgi:hypothetical protein